MEYEVGSLADLISGNKLVSDSKKKKLFQIIPSEKKIVKFKSLKNLKKSEWEVEEMKNTSFGEAKSETSSPGDTNKEMKKRRKKESKHDENENEMESNSSNALCAKKRLKYKKKKEMETSNESRKECEVFVGNVPHDVTKKKLANLFKQYGKVDTVRLRCAPLSDPRIPKKVAVITKKFHPDRNSMHAFVRFTKPESAKQAVEANGIIFEDHHLRVDLISNETHHDLKKAIFLGNVPFAAEEEDLWKIFETCGTISSIRVIRDKYTGVGKGFAYINFETADAVELALKLDGTELNKRQLRVKRCIKKPPKVEVKKKKKSRKVRKHKLMKRNEDWNEGVNSDEQKIKKMEMFNEEQSSDRDKEYISDKAKEHKVNKKFLKLKIKDGNEDEKHKSGSVGSEKPTKSFSFKTSFQGQKTAEDKKFKKKKKEKINKAEVKKMSMIRKISSKSKPSLKKVKKPSLKIKSAAKKMKLKPSSK